MNKKSGLKETLVDVLQMPILDQIRHSLKCGDFEAVTQRFSLLKTNDLYVSQVVRLDRLIKPHFEDLVSAAKEANLKKIKIAILGNYTLDTLVSAVRIMLLAKGFLADIYQGGYGLMEQEIINPKSKFYAFKPDITLLAVGYRYIKEFPNPNTDRDTVTKMAEKEIEKYESFWKIISEGVPCHIVQNNFDVPLERVFGELEAKYPWTKTNYIRRLNLKLGEAAPGHVSILDIEHLSSKLGKACWFDERFYYHAKHGFSVECMPKYADIFSSLVLAIKGGAKKCLVIDLDNTLWGGVIGDDGIENVKFGQGTPAGEAYLEFAQYINDLKKRGIIIAVSSKNNEEIAKEPFLKFKEMPLKLEDISVFLANWDDKATNLKRIAKELNIGLDSFVFVDDDSMERELVKGLLPMVSVVDLPEKTPSLFKRALYDGHYFEATGFSEEDKKRSESYRAEKGLREKKSKFKNVDSFLSSLKMAGTISRFNGLDLPRITQLINKTNQFNLTTRRYNESEVKRFMEDKNCLALSARLRDKFSDYGLISVFIGFKKGAILNIDTWLMSCRVFSRGMEHFLFNHILEDCRRSGIKVLKGTYIPTKKNGLVKDLYKELGFSLLEGKDDGVTLWQRSVKPDSPVIKTHIKKENNG